MNPNAIARHAAHTCLRGLLLAGLVFVLACAGSTEEQPLRLETGPDAEVTPEGLVRAKGSSFRDLWVKPDADIASYDALLIGPIRIAYKRPPKTRRQSIGGNNFALDSRQTRLLEDLLREELVEQIDQSPTWTLAEAVAPNVLLIEPGLVDLVVNVPTDAPPNSTTYTTSAGKVTLLLELRDSVTGELLARVSDRREARKPGSGSQNLYWSNPVNNRTAVQALFKRWARILVDRLDTAHRIGAAGPPEAGPPEM